jgi:hypothetical protein
LRTLEEIDVASDAPAIRVIAHFIRAMPAMHTDEVPHHFTYRF